MKLKDLRTPLPPATGTCVISPTCEIGRKFRPKRLLSHLMEAAIFCLGAVGRSQGISPLNTLRLWHETVTLMTGCLYDICVAYCLYNRDTVSITHDCFTNNVKDMISESGCNTEIAVECDCHEYYLPRLALSQRCCANQIREDSILSSHLSNMYISCYMTIHHSRVHRFRTLDGGACSLLSVGQK